MGRKMGLPFEQDMLKVVRRYLLTLLFPILLILSGFTLIGYMFISVLSVFVTIPRGAIFPGAVIVGVCVLAQLVHLAFRSFTQDAACQTQKKEGEYLVLNLVLTEHMARLSANRGTPRIPVYESDQVALGELRGYRNTNRIVVSTRALVSCGQMPLLGMLAHEVAHAVLPFGNFTYTVCASRLIWIDKMLRKIEEYILGVSFESPNDDVPGQHYRLSRRHICAMTLFRLLRPFSSYSMSQAREYAVDAIAVFILGHTHPILAILERIEGYERGTFILVRTHPRTRSRISAISRMKA